MSDIKKLLEHIDGINASTSSKKQLSEAGWTPNEAQRKWLGGADINDPFIIARLPARLGPKPGIPNLPPTDQEIAKQYNRGVDNANRIRSFFGLKTGDDQSASQPSAPANQSTPTLPAKSSSPTTDTQSHPGTTRPGLRIPWQLPDGKVDIVPSEVKTQIGIRQPAVPIELNEIGMEESGLQAYLGNKKYGKEGMDALRKAGREGASKEKMAKIRAKYDKLDEQGVAEDATQRSAANRLAKKFENYLTNRFEMLESGYGSEKKKFKVEAAPTYPNAQDPNAQTTSPQPPTAPATKDERDEKREQQVDIATAKATMSGLKNVLGPNLDINQAASAVTKINDRKPLTGPEQQAMSAITPLLAKAAEMPQTASNLKTSLTNAAYLAKLGK